MDDQELKDKLRKMGKGAFVTHFWKFNDLSLSICDIASYLMSLKDSSGAQLYTDDSCRTRASAGRSIIIVGRAKDALDNISQSRVPCPVREEARKIAAQL